MALIKCPDCGNEISSNAKQCIKCGCQITCCPECLTVYSGAVDVCKVCGYEFKPKLNEEKLSAKVQTEKIEQMFNADVKTSKKFSVVSKILEIVTVAVIGIGVLLYSNWSSNSNDLEKLNQMKTLFDGLKVIAIISLTVFILSFSLDDFVIYFLEVRRNNWLQYQKFDCKAYIKEYNSCGAEEKDAKAYLSLLKRSAFIIENPNEKYFSLAEIALQVVLFLITDICVCVWFTSNLNNLYMVKFISLSADYTWQFGQASFIAAIIFLVLAILVNIFGSIPQDNRYKKWCAENEN